jgi:hypothetical protein
MTKKEKASMGLNAMAGDHAASMDTLKRVLKAIGNYKFILIISILLAGSFCHSAVVCTSVIR